MNRVCSSPSGETAYRRGHRRSEPGPSSAGLQRPICGLDVFFFIGTKKSRASPPLSGLYLLDVNPLMFKRLVPRCKYIVKPTLLILTCIL